MAIEKTPMPPKELFTLWKVMAAASDIGQDLYMQDGKYTDLLNKISDVRMEIANRGGGLLEK